MNPVSTTSMLCLLSQGDNPQTTTLPVASPSGRVDHGGALPRVLLGEEVASRSDDLPHLPQYRAAKRAAQPAD